MQEAAMDFELSTHEPPRRRGPVALWMLAALIGIILGAAALAAAVTPDSRDFLERHRVVHGMRAL
jgi:hypothetical protein